MRIQLTAAAVVLALPGIEQRGGVTSVTASQGSRKGVFVFTVSGQNPCNGVSIDFGDGTSDSQNIRGLPATFTHVYQRDGNYQARATGTRNCGGQAAARVSIGNVGGINQGGGNIRFQGMDRNGDGRITRDEWRGSDQSFRVHDSNGDGVLSGAEIRAAGGAGTVVDRDYNPNSYEPADWTQRGFQRLDYNRDNRLTRDEWHYDLETFLRIDRNRDNAISLNEYLGNDFDDDRSDRFDFLDANRNNRVERSEWHGSQQAFDWLDANRDGSLSRSEVAAEEGNPADLFDNLDLNRDRRVSVNEWQWSRASFDRLDRNRDGYLTRAEMSVTPLDDPSRLRSTLVVRGNEPWIDTGAVVRSGETIRFSATGSVQLSDDPQDVADPAGSRKGRLASNAPLPAQPAGALIGRIGDSVFLIGGNADVRMPASGRLYLSVNDDHLPDNNGELRVTMVRGR